MDYPWYSTLQAGDYGIEQGDFIPDCPFVIPPAKLTFSVGEKQSFEIKQANSIILSQSCDLAHNKIEIVMLCAHYPLSYWVNELPSDRKSKKGLDKTLDKLREGSLPSFHLLNSSSEIGYFDEEQVVDFRNIYSIHIDALNEIVSQLSPRYRLLPPYREQLSQAFAKFFMRVGLPVDIRIDRDRLEKRLEQLNNQG